MAYELGIMQYQGKECLILRHTSLPETPFDLIKDLHRPYNRDLVANQNVERWIAQVRPDRNDDDRSRPPSRGSSRTEIRSADEDLAVSKFRWRATRAPGPASKIDWSLRITNRGTTGTGYRLRLVLEDQEHFLLDDYTESSTRPLEPGQHRDHKSGLPLEGDLAERLSRVVAQVSRQES